jgi:hypothetical protein
MLASLLSVIAGVSIWLMFSYRIDRLLCTAFTPEWRRDDLLLLSTVLASLPAGFITAITAPNHMLIHVLVLLGIQCVFVMYYLGKTLSSYQRTGFVAFLLFANVTAVYLSDFFCFIKGFRL